MHVYCIKQIVKWQNGANLIGPFVKWCLLSECTNPATLQITELWLLT